MIAALLPDTVEKFNVHCDKINETFGDKNDESSYSLNKDIKFSHLIYYRILFNEELSNKCNISEWNLCLKNDLNYCIVCEDDNYSIIEDQKYPYGKLKIFSEKKSDSISNEITEEKMDVIINEITN